MTAAITIHFRKPGLTRQCVDSLLADGWDPILVWDNSGDEGESLGSLERAYAAEPRVHIARNAVNLGFGRGMNSALAALCRQGYVGPVLLVNNDAQVKPGMRAALEARLEDGDDAMLIAPRLVQDGREQGWLYYQPWLALVTRRRLPGSFAYLSGCCLLVQRPDNAQPLFDEDFFMYGEDVELSWRFHASGARLTLLDGSYVCHEGSASSGQASEAYERFLVRSHWLLARKLAPNSMAGGLMRALRIPTLTARACVRALRYKSLRPIRAILALIE